MIEKIKVYGRQKVNGKVRISGAKNAALPLLAAALLSSDGLHLKNVPPLTDITTMLALLENLGITYQVSKDSPYAHSVKLKTDALENFTAPYEIVKKMRASVLVLGPLLSRFGHCRVSLPGGCAIGVRPIDLHLKGMEALGATTELRDGYVHASAPNGLRGAEFTFPIVTVTGTENVMMAAALADGTTVLKNAAQEPEVVDLANCLNKMGADISGHGTDIITIQGVTSLHSSEHTVVPDRIEAGTYAIAAGITGGRVDLLGGDFGKLLPAFLDKMELAGLVFSPIDDGLRVESSGKILPLDVDTEPFPGYPTDLQAQCMAMLCFADGDSHIRENIWENRFMHVAELMRMGADISVSGTQAYVKGVKRLAAAPVMATDLRASFSLVLAALAADGDTLIDRAYHLDRGYCCVREKFADCGVEMERIK
ncbi:MAG: UDP-N-acetylglucosamine 1-carboxyvinyltransferase [Holosporaceae bacterium]|jgi:UDP-N-acetylglucosamine 1-carboxyvinyltransferase|nr:UDP-N-acetylglucosamine 1-carboxyvinyltransferase [Holosporaceae bacterium]